jgi:hypothetical protein
MFGRIIAATNVSLMLAALLPAVAAAPQTTYPGQQTTYPGQMTEARVWVQNHGRNDAVSVDLREVSLERPMSVHVANGENGAGDILAVQTRAGRQLWDYDTLVIAAQTDIAAALNARGAAGWEAVGIVRAADDRTTVLLKRPR